MDSDQLRDTIEALPGAAAIWFDGPAALPRLLASCGKRRLAQTASVLRDHWSPAWSSQQDQALQDLHELNSRWRHAVSSGIEWHGAHGLEVATLIPEPEPRPHRTRAAARRARRVRPRHVTLTDYERAVDLAENWNELEPISVGLKTGDVEVSSSSGRHIWVRNHRRADIEVLDILLEQVTVADYEPPLGETRRIDTWFAAKAGSASALALLNHLPRRLLDIAWTDTEALLAFQGSTMPPGTDLGGITLAEARTCYAFLITQLKLNEMAAMRCQDPSSLLWFIKPHNLVRALSSRVSPEAARAFQEMLLFRRGRSPLSAPLIPHRDLLIVPSEIVSSIGVERTLLRSASADPRRSGALGNELGKRAHRWADRLRTVPECSVATGILVKEAGGRTVGDLDVAAWDASQRVLFIVETKWPVDAATLAESYKVDATFDKGRGQLSRLRSEIAAGKVRVQWPADWDIQPDTDASWWVGSAQQLDSRSILDDKGIGATSLRLVEHLLPARSLSDLAERLTTPPLPKRGAEFDLVPATITAGEWTVHYDQVALLGTPPLPPPERRVRHGWT